MRWTVPLELPVRPFNGLARQCCERVDFACGPYRRKVRVPCCRRGWRGPPPLGPSDPRFAASDVRRPSSRFVLEGTRRRPAGRAPEVDPSTPTPMTRLLSSRSLWTSGVKSHRRCRRQTSRCSRAQSQLHSVDCPSFDVVSSFRGTPMRLAGMSMSFHVRAGKHPRSASKYDQSAYPVAPRPRLARGQGLSADRFQVERRSRRVFPRADRPILVSARGTGQCALLDPTGAAYRAWRRARNIADRRGVKPPAPSCGLPLFKRNRTAPRAIDIIAERTPAA